MGFHVTLADVSATVFQALVYYRNRREEVKTQTAERKAQQQASMARTMSTV